MTASQRPAVEAVRIRLEPAGFPGTDLVIEAANLAAANLGMDARLRELEIVFDAPEFSGSSFFMVQNLPQEAGFKAQVYGSPEDVLARGAVGGDPDALSPARLRELDPDAVDRMRLDRWLHRNLLQLDDLLSGRVDPTGIPAGKSLPLQSLWDVWTDGRLRERQMPGLTQAERRSIFFRVFARHGLLLPRHWRLFHELWEGKHANQAGLLRALEGLPEI
jgi:hypothetical protein